MGKTWCLCYFQYVKDEENYSIRPKKINVVFPLSLLKKIRSVGR